MLQNRLSSKVALLLLLFLITYSSGFTQDRQRKFNNRNKTGQVKNKKKKAIQGSPKIYDVSGNLISVKKAMEILANADVESENIYKNGQIVGAKLVKNKMIGKQPLDFSFNTVDGKIINLSGQRGKITVLNFWYVGCQPCLTEIPVFNKIVGKYDNIKDINFFALTFIAPEDSNGLTNLESFLKEHKFDFKISIASKSILEAFKINAYPTTIVLDKEGKIVFWRTYIGENAQPLNALLEGQLKK